MSCSTRVIFKKNKDIFCISSDNILFKNDILKVSCQEGRRLYEYSLYFKSSNNNNKSADIIFEQLANGTLLITLDSEEELTGIYYDPISGKSDPYVILG